MEKTPRIYLAGPDLFFPDADDRYSRLRAACQFAGGVGVAPSDELDLGLVGTGSAMDGGMARAIYAHDMRTLASCDAVLANLSAFRGTEPDSGTVFEAAYAFALGIPVVGYTVDGLTVAERHLLVRKCAYDADGMLIDKAAGDGGMIENFGLPTNLMLACSFPVVQTPQEAIAILKSTYLHQGETLARSQASGPRHGINFDAEPKQHHAEWAKRHADMLDEHAAQEGGLSMAP